MKAFHGYNLSLLLRSLFSLVKWDIKLKTTKYSRWQKALIANETKTSNNSHQSTHVEQALNYYRHIEFWKRHLPINVNCLRRSLAMKDCLNAKGIKSQLHIGVKLTNVQSLSAHAWVTVNQHLVNDNQHNIGQYTEVKDFEEKLFTSLMQQN